MTIFVLVKKRKLNIKYLSKMKKIAFIAGLLMFCLNLAFAQQMPELPIDPKVLHGKLDNGMTYYIRHNELPKGQADFYIAHNVGAILEEDHQNGLAHFLEHMAFNGSTHFPGNTLISYLESIGVKFGANLNAYTSWDRTVYNISNVPLTRSGILDTCLLVLHDWSGSLLLQPEEIDKERGVIREEMRTRGDANWRMLEKMLPEILPGNIYSKRNLIGTEDIILNFEPKTLRDFYEKWYRPDLQALIIVGDIEPDYVLGKLKEMFKDDKAPINPVPRPWFEVEDNKEPLLAIATDKEATYTGVTIDFKHKPLPKEFKSTVAGLINDYMNSIISRIMGERLRELTQQANPPFIGASVSNSLFANTATEESLSGSVAIKENEIELGMKAIVREIERVNQYGFNQGEYDRARTNLITGYESAFNEREKTRTGSYCQEYVSHFAMGGYIPGIEVEYNIISTIAPEIPLEAINQYIQELIGDENIVILLTAPEKEDVTLPSKEDLLRWFNEARSEKIEPLKETASNEPLLSELPKGGSIVKESQEKIFDTYNCTLSNGVKVVIKPTTLKDDEIQMRSFSPGGSSHFPESEIENIKVYGSVSTLGGLGNFKATDLTKVLAGKRVSASPYVSLLNEGINGSSNVRDFETMLQLVYLNFTAPRMDEEAFQSFINRTKSQLESQEANPNMALVDTFVNTMYENVARNSRIKVSDLSKINYQMIMDWRKDRFADASDFTFVFTGNIDPEESKALIAQYIGGLPSINRKEEALPVNMELKKGKAVKHFDQKMENVKATVIDTYTANFEPTLKNKLKMSMLQQILQIVYTEKVREDEGGTYGVGVSGSISEYPKGQTVLQMNFDTENDKATYLNEIVHREFKNITTEGPRQDDFDKVREFMAKRHGEQLQENGYWSSVISEYYRIGFDGHSDYLQTVESITPKDIQEMAKSILDSGNSAEIIMKGIK